MASPLRGAVSEEGALLAGGATLEAGALQHLLVLLLAHALAALLDQRSHGGEQGTGTPARLRTDASARPETGYRRLDTLAGSSTGRTPDFGSGGWRFEPSPASPATTGILSPRDLPSGAVDSQIDSQAVPISPRWPMPSASLRPAGRRGAGGCMNVSVRTHITPLAWPRLAGCGRARSRTQRGTAQGSQGRPGR